MGVAAVNLSSGYYNAHTLHEYINRKQINAVIQAVIGIIADAAKPDFPKYEYIERVWKFSNFGRGFDAWETWPVTSSDCRHDAKKVPMSMKAETMKETIPSDLPYYMTEMYNDLLEFYDLEELEWYRKEYGDQIISQLYNDEFGPFFDVDDVWEGEGDPFYDGRKEKQ